MNKDEQSSQTREPILLVGWDGAPHHLISELLDDGELPTLQNIADEGYYGPLETVPYVMSSCAWSTFLTGKNAGKHGIYDFYANDFREDSYFREPIDATSRDAPDIGEVLNNHGRTIGQLNVPMTYPTRDIKDFAVTGMLSPGIDAPEFTTPEDFLDDYEHLDGYKIDVGEGKDADRETFLNAIQETVDNRMRLVRYSLGKEHPDVFFVVFTSPDRLSHYYYHFFDEDHPFRKNETDEDLKKYADVLPDLYRDLDEKLAEIIDLFEAEYDTDPTVGVVSDHGMTSLERIFHVNKWLSQNGYLTFKDGFDATVDEDTEEKLDDRVEYIFGKVDWSETVAYSMGKRGAIYVNLEGREPKGSVPPEEYEDVVESLAADLQHVEDPELGENVVQGVHRREELFHGNHIDRAPDLLLTMDDGYFPFGYAFELDSPELFSTNDWEDMPFVTGIEGTDGIICIAGDGIDSAASDVDIGLQDVFPLLLHYLGHPVSEDIDGDVPTDLLTDQYLGEGVRYTAETERATADEETDKDEEDQQSVKDRLEDLGYL